ncbi:MAG: hypothetical protein R3D89_02910 [Sphingomonadaceae bacterium]
MSISKNALAACLAAAALLPAPAMAQESSVSEIQEKLNDPMTQYAVAGMISAMSKAMLEMEIGPFMKSMEQATGRHSNVPEDATVADLAGTNPDEVQDKLIETVPAMMASAGTMAGAFEKMLPQLREMAERMKDAIPARP